MTVIDSCTRGKDLGHSVFTLLMSLTHFSLFIFNATKPSAFQSTFSSHSSRYRTLPMTWLCKIKANGSGIEVA